MQTTPIGRIDIALVNNGPSFMVMPQWKPELMIRKVRIAIADELVRNAEMLRRDEFMETDSNGITRAVHRPTLEL